MKQDRIYFFDKKSNVWLVIYVFHAFCIALFIADFIIHRHSYHRWEEIPAFYALFGFLAYVVIVFTAAALRKLIMRAEDYYEAREEVSND